MNQIKNYISGGKQPTFDSARQANDLPPLNNFPPLSANGQQNYAGFLNAQFRPMGPGACQNNLITITPVVNVSATTPVQYPPALTNGQTSQELNVALLRDPRRRSRSFSLGGGAAAVRPSPIQNFDVRSTEKPISIKFFSKCNLSDTITSNALSKAAPQIQQSASRTAPTTATSAPEATRSRRDLFDANNNEVVIISEDDDDDREASGLINKTRDYSPDYRKKKDQQKAAAFESDYDYYQEPRRAKRSKIPLYKIEDYIPQGVLITTESLRSYSKAINNQRSVVESDSITREEAVRRINEIAVDGELEEIDNQLNLSKVAISDSYEQEKAIGFKLDKLTRAAAFKATSAIPAAISEFEPAAVGFFVPAIVNPREKNLNFVNEFESKNVDTVNYKIELKRFAKEHNLPDPEFTRPVYIDNNALSGFSSRLKIGDKTWFTVLNARQTPDDADNKVAKQALNELKLKVELQNKQEDAMDLISKIIKVEHWPAKLSETTALSTICAGFTKLCLFA